MGQRDYKQFSRGCYYHIYNRGNGKKDIFLDDEDFAVFMKKLKANLFPDDLDSDWSKGRFRLLPPGSFSLVSYCLMPNHFHLLVKQNSEIPTSKLLLKVCTSHSMYFNKKYKHVGHVFQDRFRQEVIDDNRYLTWLTGYIHSNPVVAGLVDDPLDYKWSSHGEYCGRAKTNICEKGIILDQFKSRADFHKFVKSCQKIIKNKKDLERLLIDGEEDSG